MVRCSVVSVRYAPQAITTRPKAKILANKATVVTLRRVGISKYGPTALRACSAGADYIIPNFFTTSLKRRATKGGCAV